MAGRKPIMGRRKVFMGFSIMILGAREVNLVGICLLFVGF